MSFTLEHSFFLESKALENAISLDRIQDTLRWLQGGLSREDKEDYRDAIRQLQEEAMEAQKRVLVMNHFVKMFSGERKMVGDDKNGEDPSDLIDNEDPCDLGLSFKTLFP